MNCPKCGRPMKYLNQDFRTHGWYCLEAACKGWIKCDQECCYEICPRCFGSGNWPWAQWGGPCVCILCNGSGKISASSSAKAKEAPVDRRNPKCPPRPGMIWNAKHKMWTDVDYRTPEEKALHEKISAAVEAELRRSNEQSR